MRVLPAVQPPAFMSDAGESVRKAWAAMSASVAGCLPTEMPPLPRLPNLSLPQLNLPSFRLPQRPTISPPLGRFFSSLSTLMFAPGQIHGMAIYYQVATFDMVSAASDGPRVECVDVAAKPWAAQSKISFDPGAPSRPMLPPAVATPRSANQWRTAAPSAFDFALASALVPVPVRHDVLVAWEQLTDLDRENWVDLAAQGTRVRGQRPPPRGVDIPA
ncbi:hypothetical protein AYO41_03250 [Verrucomicrobia bacterium SCGC AG-212-E04]|nr:hypothetical protein AYO41_03250 [Verrucomicrobia bacterium SCGC AG-212-E04]